VINKKITVTKIGLHHHDQVDRGHYAHRVLGQWIKENFQKQVESMPKRVS